MGGHLAEGVGLLVGRAAWACLEEGKEGLGQAKGQEVGKVVPCLEGRPAVRRTEADQGLRVEGKAEQHQVQGERQQYPEGKVGRRLGALRRH